MSLLRVVGGGLTIATALWVRRNPQESLVNLGIRSVMSAMEGMSGLGSALCSWRSSGTAASPIAAGSEVVLRAIFGPPGSFCGDNKTLVMVCAVVASVSILSLLDRARVLTTHRVLKLCGRIAPTAGMTVCSFSSLALALDCYKCWQVRPLLMTWAIGVGSSLLAMTPSILGFSILDATTTDCMAKALCVANTVSATILVAAASAELRAVGPEAVAAVRVASAFLWLLSLSIVRSCEVMVGKDFIAPVAQYVGKRIIVPACNFIHESIAQLLLILLVFSRQGYMLAKQVFRSMTQCVILPAFVITKNIIERLYTTVILPTTEALQTAGVFAGRTVWDRLLIPIGRVIYWLASNLCIGLEMSIELYNQFSDFVWRHLLKIRDVLFLAVNKLLDALYFTAQVACDRILSPLRIFAIAIAKGAYHTVCSVANATRDQLVVPLRDCLVAAAQATYQAVCYLTITCRDNILIPSFYSAVAATKVTYRAIYVGAKTVRYRILIPLKDISVSAVAFVYLKTNSILCLAIDKILVPAAKVVADVILKLYTAAKRVLKYCQNAILVPAWDGLCRLAGMLYGLGVRVARTLARNIGVATCTVADVLWSSSVPTVSCVTAFTFVKHASSPVPCLSA